MEPHQDTSPFSSDSSFSESHDPVEKSTEWSPLVKGGSNFRTHKLKKVGYHTYQAVPTVGYYLFNLVFVLIGAGAIVGAYYRITDSFMMDLLFGLMGILFFALGLTLLIKSLKPFTIDLDMGVYYKGSSYDPYVSGEEQPSGSIRDIHALQIITENITGSKTKSRSPNSYNSYEINIVLKDGRRVNVMDHGNRKKIQEDAALLSEALNVPIWNPALWALDDLP